MHVLAPRAKGTRKQHRFATTVLDFFPAKRHYWGFVGETRLLSPPPPSPLFAMFFLEKPPHNQPAESEHLPTNHTVLGRKKRRG